jgi:nicotinamidase-related amidase
MPGAGGAFPAKTILFARQWGPGGVMQSVKRIYAERCCGLVIDVQDFFLAQVKARQRAALKSNLANLIRLLNYFHIPIVATLERTLEYKGGLPKEIAKHLGGAGTFEKNFFDLTKEKEIKNHLARLKRRQMIVAGCETDVCVLQSCLGLIALGYEVFVVEELTFSSARNVASAVERMKNAGAVFLTYKTLYYELIEAVDGGHQGEKMRKALGRFPDDIPDIALS